MGDEKEFTFVCKNIEIEEAKPELLGTKRKEAKPELPDIKRELVQRLIHDYEIKIQALEELLEE